MSAAEAVHGSMGAWELGGTKRNRLTRGRGDTVTRGKSSVGARVHGSLGETPVIPEITTSS